jgi:hypothetical protein
MAMNLRALPGLKRFLDILNTHGVSTELAPPSPVAPASGDLVLGLPFDPVLARIYSRTDGGLLGDLELLHMSDPEGLRQFNEHLLMHEDDYRFSKVVRYAKVDSMAYYFATVPSLAGSDGMQPIVYVTDYVDKVFQPIASDADLALGLYARYMDDVLRETGSIYGVTGNPFPYCHLGEIVKDRKLIQMLEAGRFDELTSPDSDSREWVSKVLARARAPRPGPVPTGRK